MEIRQKSFVFIWCLIAVVVIGCYFWWKTPSSMIHIPSSKVSRIVVFNGHTGHSVTIKDRNEITHIINNLDSVRLKKEQLSFGSMGYYFRTTIYKENGNAYKSFVINSKDVIRKDPFFYKASSNSIDLNYIKQLVENN